MVAKGEHRPLPVKITRDLVLYCLGLAIIVNEVWFMHDVRPYILILASALVGLPVFLRGAQL